MNWFESHTYVADWTAAAVSIAVAAAMFLPLFKKNLIHARGN
jgi:hypothetical protein